MKAKPFRGTPVPSLAGKGWSNEITRAELVALVAARVPRGKSDDEATVRNRVSSMVTHDVNISGKLCTAASGLFELGGVALWASQKWPGRFDDLPKRPLNVVVTSGQGGQIVSARAYVVPQSLPEIHGLIRELYADNDALERELAALKTRLNETQAKAAKWDHWNSTRGRKPKR